jgi:small subunit ribosomal protein S15
MAISAQTKSTTIQQFRRHEKDCGSPETQIALLTGRIKELSSHLQTHRKDVHSRRGLLMMVSRRNRLLRYLSRTDHAKYVETIQRLGLRK